MEKVIDLKDLLKHEILDLCSAEEQIIDALPLMINKAGNAKLKAALKDHLKVTKDQKARLDEIKELLAEVPAEGEHKETKKAGFFSRLFGGGEEKCKGMEGLITEGKKMMAADMSPEAADAAIIASAQKIEHYEISGYGTARAFARELNLAEVASKLEQTLNEEYAADDLLTQLAVGKVNIDAEFAGGSKEGSSSGASLPTTSRARQNGRAEGSDNSNNSTSAKSKAKSIPAKKSLLKSAPAKSASKSAADKGRTSSPKKVASVGTKDKAGSATVADKKSLQKKLPKSKNDKLSSKK